MLKAKGKKGKNQNISQRNTKKRHKPSTSTPNAMRPFCITE